MKVALYPRVSTQEQAKEGYSIGEQIDRLKKYSAAMGWEVYKIYTDAGFSGANMDRPGLQEMIKDVKAGKINKVVVYKLDRLSRSQLDTLYLIEKVFLANGTDFVSMNESFDTSTSFGRAMIGVLAVFAQLEREQIKERMSVGKEGRAKEGLWHGGQQPIGYDYNSTTDQLEINDFEAMCVREAADLFEMGTPLRTIETLFLERGYRHKYGVWSASRIRSALSNPLNAGRIVHNGTIYQGQHPSIIPPKQFDAILPMLQERSEKFRALAKDWKYTSYLGGLIHCERCGGKYTKQAGRSWKGNPAPMYYTCYSRSKKVKKMIKDPNCKNKNWKMHELDELIFSEIKKLSVDPDYIHELRKDDNGETIPDKSVVLTREIAEIDKQISKFMDLYALGTIGIDLITDKITPLEEARNKLNEELNALPKSDEKMTDTEVLEIASTFGEVLERGDFDEIRIIIEQLIEKIGIDGDDVIIYWRFA